ncbi:PKD domain-containing protein [Anabaenopsis arnoldii]|nr:PKD domain-containing protein [Anabaenopsis arnoldii]
MASVLDVDKASVNVSGGSSSGGNSGGPGRLILGGNTVDNGQLSGTPDIQPVYITSEKLQANLYTTGGAITTFPNFSSLTPIASQTTGVVQQSNTTQPFSGFNLQNPPVDNFAVLWTGKIELINTGNNQNETVTFFLSSDDGSRLYINNQLVVDHGGLHGFSEKSGQIALSPGIHDIRVELFEHTGSAGIQLDYQIPGQPRQLLSTAPIQKFDGVRASNPFITDNTVATPFIADLIGGANVHGLLDLSIADLGIAGDIPEDALAAIYRVDIAPGKYNVNYFDVDSNVDFDMLLFINVSGENIFNPQLGIDLNQTNQDFLKPLLAGGTPLTRLGNGQIWATLIPDDDSIFINAALNYPRLVNTISGQNLKDGEAVYIRPTGLTDITISPDGKHLYGVNQLNALVVVNTSNITQEQIFQDGTVQIEGLDESTAVTISADGNYVYLAGATEEAISVFNRDANTGKLTINPEASWRGTGTQTITTLTTGVNHQVFAGVSPINNSDNSGQAGVLLFHHDPVTGKLTLQQPAFLTDSLKEVTAIEVSPDGSKVYAISRQDNQLVVLNATDLQEVQRLTRADVGDRNVMRGISDLAVTDKFIYTLSAHTGTLAVFPLDAEGKLVIDTTTQTYQPIQILRDGTSGIRGFKGAADLTITSTDNRQFLYVTSGEINTLPGLEIDKNTGRLQLLQIVRNRSLTAATDIVANDGDAYVSAVVSTNPLAPPLANDFGITKFNFVPDAQPQKFIVTFDKLQTLTINTGSQGDLIEQKNAPTVQNLNINTGEGFNTIDLVEPKGNVSISSLGDGDFINVRNGENVTNLTINSGAGADNIKISGVIAKGGNIDAGIGENQLTIVNTKGIETITADFNQNAITLAGVDGTTVNLGDGGNRINLIASTIKSHVAVKTGSGDNEIFLDSANENDTFTVNTGSGSDKFRVNGENIKAGANVILNGGNGENLLEFRSAGNDIDNLINNLIGSIKVRGENYGAVSYQNIRLGLGIPQLNTQTGARSLTASSTPSVNMMIDRVEPISEGDPLKLEANIKGDITQIRFVELLLDDVLITTIDISQLPAANNGQQEIDGVTVTLLEEGANSYNLIAEVKDWFTLYDLGFGDNGFYNLTVRATDTNEETILEDIILLTINNSAPKNLVINASQLEINQGDTIEFQGDFIDFGDDAHTYIWDFGDGTRIENIFKINHTYTKNGIYPVTFTVTDDDGGRASFSTEVTVNNLPPQISIENNTIITKEGDAVVNSGTWSDIDNDIVTLTASVGTVTVNEDGTWIWNFNSTDGPDESQTVTITATDSDNATSETTFNLTVENVAPQIGVNNNRITISEGDTAFNSGTWSDAGNDAVTLTASVGTVTTNDGTWSWNFNSTDGPDESQTVTITATDSDRATSVTTFNLTVANVAPQISVNNNSITVSEGNTAVNGGTWIDAGKDIVTLTASVGTVTVNEDGTWSWNFDSTDGQNGTQTVTITATDSDSATSESRFNLTVENVAPTIVNLTVPTSLNEGEEASFSALATDVDNELDYVWDFAAGNNTSSNQKLKGADVKYTYPNNGIYQASLTVTDSDGAFLTEQFNIVVSNVAPQIGVNNNSITVSEGVIAVNSGIWSDAGNDAVTLTASVGTVTANQDGTWSWNFDSTDSPIESQTVTITATDSDNATSETTFNLTVENVAPQIGVNNNRITVSEGVIAINSGTWSDRGNDIVTLTASVGAITTNQDGTWSWNFNSIDSPNGTQTVTITATDSDRATSETTFNLTVENVAPEISVNNNRITVSEGVIAVNSGIWSDAGNDTVTLTASVGAITANQDGTWSWNFNSTNGPDESQTVTITATDSDRATTETTFDLTVNNVAPQIGVNNNSITVSEGVIAVNSGIWSDAGNDIVTLTASVGAITANQDGTWSWNFNSTNGPDESQTVTITATDSDNATSVTTFNLTVENVAPEISVNNNSITVSKGETAVNSGTWSDRGNDTVTLTASVGAITTNQDGTWSWNFNSTNGPDESQTVTITATDSDRASSVTTFVTTVSGLAADIDGNGKVTGADLLLIDQYLLLRNNPNVDAILQSSFNLFSTETVGATNTTGTALRSAIANGVNKLAFDVDGNGQVTGGDIFLIRQALLLKNNPNVNAILETTFNLFTSELTGPRNTGAKINAFISSLLG